MFGILGHKIGEHVLKEDFTGGCMELIAGGGKIVSPSRVPIEEVLVVKEEVYEVRRE